MKYTEAPEWFFAWIKGQPYITSICGWTRKDVIRQAQENMGKSWQQIRNQGGRAVRCTVRERLEEKP